MGVCGKCEEESLEKKRGSECGEERGGEVVV